MATLRSLLSKFKSISRPSLLSSSATSSTSSYVKKQASAEDAIYDEQYANGVLSPEAYLSNLKVRSARSWNTPLTNVNLEKKMVDVQQTINDATVSQKYSSGDITTSDVLNYEQEKLNKMTEPGSAAYIKQQQKVQELQTKLNTEERSNTRRETALKISQMPDDSSKTLWAKQQMYAQLAEQARIDGDANAATTYETQANNYKSSAQKADINDLITQARLSVSETPNGGFGTPSAEGGLSRLFGGSGQGGATADGGLPTGTAPSAVSGYSTSAQNILKSIDRSYMTIERLTQSIQDKQTLIQAYKDAVDQATGDQKTTLTTQLNNLEQSLASDQNQFEITSSSIEDAVVRLQEAQSKAAASSFGKEVTANNLQFKKVENNLETAFAKGQISKEDYIRAGIELAATKEQYFGQVSGAFSDFGNDASAESYAQKQSDIAEIHQRLIGVGENIANYEPIAVDPGGTVKNIFGQTVNPGDIILTNVQQMKDSGVFDFNYIKNGNSYYRVHYPGEVSGVTGLPMATSIDQITGLKEGKAYIYVGNDKMPVTSATFLDENNNPVQKLMTVPEAKKQVDLGGLIEDKGGVLRQKTEQDFLNEARAATGQDGIKRFLPTPGPETLKAIETKITGNPQAPVVSKAAQIINDIQQAQQAINPYDKFSDFFNIAGVPLRSIVNGAGDMLRSAGQSIGNKVSDTFSSAKEALSNAGNTVTNAVGNLLNNIKVPSLVKKAYASEGTGLVAGTPAQYEGLITEASKKYDVPPAILSALLKQESGFNPNAVSPVGARGIAQFMPATAKQFGINPDDPSQAIPAAAKYLAQNFKQFGSWDQALAAYNAGPGAVQQYGGVPPYEETQNYVKKITSMLGNEDNKIIGSVFGATSTPAEAKSNTPEPVLPGNKNAYLTSTSKAGPFTVTTNQVVQPRPVTDFTPVEPFKPKVYDLINPSIPPSNIGEAMRNLVDNVGYDIKQATKNISLPKISIPKISLPKIDLPSIVNNVQQKAQPVINTVSNAVSNAVSNVKNWWSKLFK